MSLLSFVLITALFLFGPNLSAEPAKTPGKKSMNTSIYEAESNQGISAKVKTFKSSREDTLVYFEGLKKSGPYVLSGTIKDYVKIKNRLAKSAEPRGPTVNVSVDDQDQILSVEISEPNP